MTFNDESLVSEFKAFVAEQPPQETINHNSYSTCACGAFARLNGLYGMEVADALERVHGRAVGWSIGSGGMPNEREGIEPVAMKNYGELSTWLQSLTVTA